MVMLNNRVTARSGLEERLQNSFFIRINAHYVGYDKDTFIPYLVWKHCFSDVVDLDKHVREEVLMYMTWLAELNSRHELHSAVWMKYARYIGRIMKATGFDFDAIETYMNDVVDVIIDTCKDLARRFER